MEEDGGMDKWMDGDVIKGSIILITAGILWIIFKLLQYKNTVMH